MNVSPEKLDQGFTHCFSLGFASLEALELYQQNSDYMKFQEILKPHMLKVFVIDYFRNNLSLHF